MCLLWFRYTGSYNYGSYGNQHPPPMQSQYPALPHDTAISGPLHYSPYHRSSAQVSGRDPWFVQALVCLAAGLVNLTQLISTFWTLCAAWASPRRGWSSPRGSSILQRLPTVGARPAVVLHSLSRAWVRTRGLEFRPPFGLCHRRIQSAAMSAALSQAAPPHTGSFCLPSSRGWPRRGLSGLLPRCHCNQPLGLTSLALQSSPHAQPHQKNLPEMGPLSDCSQATRFLWLFPCLTNQINSLQPVANGKCGCTYHASVGSSACLRRSGLKVGWSPVLFSSTSSTPLNPPLSWS